jgi:DNA-directed RNA polymerase specialized sigma24 family protein
MATQATSPADSEPADLVHRARLGDSEALGALYDAFGAGLYRLAYRLTGSREDAEDTVHDVFVGLPEALDRYEERGRLGAWLRRVTARVALRPARLTAGRWKSFADTQMVRHAFLWASRDLHFVVQTEDRRGDFVIQRLLATYATTDTGDSR